MTDPISDMLTRIRNASIVKKDKVLVPYSKIKFEIAKTLLEKGFIGNLDKRGRKIKKFLEIGLLKENNEMNFFGIKRISKPGRRIYVKSSEIKLVKSGKGISIISTPSGIMSSFEARKRKLGGEVICEVW